VEVAGSLVPLLQELSGLLDGALGLVSGRPIGEIDRLLHPVALPAVGLHGAEIRATPGTLIRTVEASLPAAARDAITRLAWRHANAFVEEKGLTVALHYDPMHSAAPELITAIEAIAREHAHDWTVLRGRHVLELKPSSVNKGLGCTALLERAPFAGRTPVYIGDDVTDLDAFAAVRVIGGVNVAVGGRIAHAADIVLSSPQEAHHWLARAAQWLRGAAPSPAPQFL
jgi:trehalose 6-phosphate phosphatase